MSRPRRAAARAWWLALALVVAASGACRFDPKLPKGQVGCATADDCPEGFACLAPGVCCRGQECLFGDGGAPDEEEDAGAPLPDTARADARVGDAPPSDAGTPPIRMDAAAAGPTDGPPGARAKGEACTLGTQCASGYCADGVCCTSLCAGQCEACAAKYTGGTSGDCNAVVAGMDPHDSCQVTTVCGQDGVCDGARQCRKAPATDMCQGDRCEDGSFTPVAFCDGAGACKIPTPVSCGGFACVGFQGCLTSCAGHDQCATGHDCVSGQCKRKANQLLENGHAEAGLTGWIALAGNVRAVAYGSGVYPAAMAQQGTMLFAGAPGEKLLQTVMVPPDFKGSIAAGRVLATVGGDLGGVGSSNVIADLVLTFHDVDGKVLGEKTVAGPTPNTRNNESRVDAYFTTATLPAGTTSLSVTIAMRGTGTQRHGLADDVYVGLSVF